MSRQSSPDIEIVEEICKTKPLVDVVLPPSFVAQVSPASAWLRSPAPRLPFLNGFQGSNCKNNVSSPIQISPTFAPKIANVRTLLPPLVNCKPTESETVPGIRVQGRSMELTQGFRIRPLFQNSSPQKSSGGATALMVVGNALNISQLGPSVECHERRLHSRFPVPQMQQEPKLATEPAIPKKKFKSQNQINLDKERKMRKRKHSSSSSGSSSSVICCDDDFPIILQRSTNSKLRIPNFNPRVVNVQSIEQDSRNVYKCHIYGRCKCNGFTARDLPDDFFDKPFQCGICEKIFGNNISMTWHAFSHFLHDEKESEVDLSDFSTCWKCLRLMVDPYRLMNHINKVHLKNSSVLANVCYICELEYDDNSRLRQHMETVHRNLLDMPYMCSVCQFQSSLYEDVVDHFAENHKNSLLLLCPLCLTVISGTGESRGHYKNVGGTISFCQHILSHAEREDPIRCDSCRLIFYANSELAKHKTKHHHIKKSPEQLMMINFDGCRPMTLTEQFGRNAKPNRLILRQLETTFDESYARCIECHRLLMDENHFIKGDSKKCSICSFATSCKFSYDTHMEEHAKNGPKSISHVAFQRIETVLDEIGVCGCGFTSKLGNKLAEHLHRHSFSCGEIVLQLDPLNAKTTALSDVLPNKILTALNLCTTAQIEDRCENDVLEEQDVQMDSFPNVDNKDVEMEIVIDLPSPRRLSLLSPIKHKNLLGNETSVPSCSYEQPNGETKTIKPELTAPSRQRSNYIMMCRHRLFKADRLMKNVDTLCEQYSLRRLCKPNQKLLLDVLSIMDAPSDLPRETATENHQYLSAQTNAFNSISMQNGSDGENLFTLNSSSVNLHSNYVLNGSSSPINIFDKLRNKPV